MTTPTTDPRSAAPRNPTDTPVARPLWSELASIPEVVAGLPGGFLAAAAAPIGSSRAVLVIPGFVTGDAVTVTLRTFLRSLGHRPSGWGLGLNVGASHHIAAGVDRLLQDMAQRHSTTVDIVGWSAGGVFGRILAQNRPELVGQVISLGSPIRLRPQQTNIGWLQDLVSRLFVTVPRHIDVDRVPVPSTTVWTRGDGVVPADLCRQTIGPNAEAVQVRGTHSALAFNPAVQYLIADRLAQHPGEWRPFAPTGMARWWYPSLENETIDATTHDD